MHLIETTLDSGVDASVASETNPSLDVLWIHDTARLTGGCEHYIAKTANLLKARGIRSTLLYGESGSGPLGMLDEFDRAFPIVDLPRQLADISPDVIYAQRVSGCETVRALRQSGFPTLRFFHDHKLFCPREHKYTVIGKTTCTKTIGIGCYACLGVINRSDRWPGVRMSTVGRLVNEQREHHPLDGFVVGSQYMARHLSDHGFPAGKTHVLPLFSDPPTNLSAIDRDTHQLLFVGQIVRGKGLDLLLHAMTLTDPTVCLSVVGTGAQEAECKQLCERLGLTSRVDFLGKMNQHRIAELYAKAGCLVLPSRSPETFGQVGIEAMSYRLPAIAANVGGISEWLTPNVNGLFCSSNDSRSLAEAISSFIETPGLAERLGDAASETYQRNFRPETHADSLASLLHRTSRSKVVR